MQKIHTLFGQLVVCLSVINIKCDSDLSNEGPIRSYNTAFDLDEPAPPDDRLAEYGFQYDTFTDDVSQYDDVETGESRTPQEELEKLKSVKDEIEKLDTAKHYQYKTGSIEKKEEEEEKKKETFATVPATSLSLGGKSKIHKINSKDEHELMVASKKNLHKTISKHAKYHKHIDHAKSQPHREANKAVLLKSSTKESSKKSDNVLDVNTVDHHKLRSHHKESGKHTGKQIVDEKQKKLDKLSEVNQVLDNTNLIDESFVTNSKIKPSKTKIHLNYGDKKGTFSDDAYVYDYHQHTALNSGGDTFEENVSDAGRTSNFSILISDNTSPWTEKYYHAESKLWIGIVVGIGICLAIGVLLVSFILCFKKRRGCSEWAKLTDGGFSTCIKDEQPIYIKLSQLHGKKRNKGSNYIVTVLDESNFSVDSSWSSEEELFGISDIVNKSSTEKTRNKSLVLAGNRTSTPKAKPYKT